MSTASSENPAKPSRVRRVKAAQPASRAIEAVRPEPKPVATSKSPTLRGKLSKVAESRVSQAKKASVMLKFVSDPTRLQVILFLAEAEHHVGALCTQLGQSQPAVSHHLALLRHGGIIIPRRQGKNNFYSLSESGADLAKVLKLLLTEPA